MLGDFDDARPIVPGMTERILGKNNYWSANNQLDLASLEFNEGKVHEALNAYSAPIRL